MGARERWYKEYRLLRIFRRESKKVLSDAGIYGNGFYFMSNSFEAKHVEYSEVMNPLKW